MKPIAVWLAWAALLATSMSKAAPTADAYYWLPPKGEARLISKLTGAPLPRTVSPDRATQATAPTHPTRVWIDPKGNVRNQPW